VVSSGNVRGKLPGEECPDLDQTGIRCVSRVPWRRPSVSPFVRSSSILGLAQSGQSIPAAIHCNPTPMHWSTSVNPVHTRTIPRYSWRVRAVTQAGATLRRTCWLTFGARRRPAAGGTVCYNSPERLRPVQRTHNLVQPVQVVNAPLPCNRISAE